jgi:hypothetical protein
MICGAHHLLLETSNPIKEDDMGGAYGTNRKEDKCIHAEAALGVHGA